MPDRTGSEVQKDPCSHANTNSYIISKAGLTKAEEELDDQELLRGLSIFYYTNDIASVIENVI